MKRQVQAAFLAIVSAAIMLHPSGSRLDATGQSSAAFAALFDEYLTGDADAAVAEFARWSWARVDAESDLITVNPTIQAALALFHIETGLLETAFAETYLRPGLGILNGDLNEREPHYRKAIHLTRRLSGEPAMRRITAQLTVASEALATRNQRGMTQSDWHPLRWLPDDPGVQLAAGTQDAWWAQTMVHEGPYAISNCLPPHPCEPTISTLEGPAVAPPVRRAESAFRASVQLDGTLAEAHLRLAHLLYLTRRHEEAQQILESLRERESSDRSGFTGHLTSLFLGQLYEYRSTPEAALEVYAAAIATRPDSAAARVAAAQLLLRAGEMGLAWRVLRGLALYDAHRSPIDPWTDYVWGQYRHVEGWVKDLRSALKIAQPFRVIRPDAPRLRVATSSAAGPATTRTPDTPTLLAALRRGRATFRSRVDAVRLDARVIHRNQPVAGLMAENFEIRDKGVRQKVELLPSEGRLALVLVLDLTQSTSARMLAELVQAGNVILDRLRPDDEVTLITFGTRIAVDVPPTRDHQEVRRALAGARRQWGARSATRDALLVGSAFAAETSAFPMVVLLGDGGDNGSLLTERRARELTRGSGVLIDVVWPRPFDPWKEPVDLQDMDISFGRIPREYITEESGGKVFRVGSPDLPAALHARLDEMRHHYILSFVPTGVAQEGWHRVTTSLKGRSGEVHVRSGYFGGLPK